jgi:maleate isomerase
MSPSHHLPKVALMVPSSNTVMETDFNRELLGKCSVHTGRMYLVETTREAEIKMVEEFAPAAAKDLGTLHPDLLVFGCTSAGSLFGAEYDLKICDSLGQIARAPAVGVLRAVSEELDRVGGKRMAVLTPYIEDLTRSVARAASTSEREVAVALGMGISDNAKLADPTPEDIVAFAKDRLRGIKFDVLLVSCTNFRALEAKAPLEEAFGVPVVTSNSAILSFINRHFNLI